MQVLNKNESTYGTAAFIERTHIKTRIVLDALELGYDVLIVDVDIVFLKNPIPFMDCWDCDIQIQNDGEEINSGFYYARPTKEAIKLHSSALELAHQNRTLSNQKCLARILVNNTSIKVKILDDEKFPRGYVFFEAGKRMFADDNNCDTCVIVHNNWIEGRPAKIYRFKEFGMWMVDNNGYYSSNSSKYLVYNNLLRLQATDANQALEIEALKSALAIGKVLNRKVILPAFGCDNCPYEACKTSSGKCRLHTYIRIKTLDKTFPDSYREHMFLKHPKVPESVKNSQSPVYLIESPFASQHKNDPTLRLLNIDKTFKPKNKEGATKDEIIEWFGNSEISKYKVLQFHSLYKAFDILQHQDGNFVKSLSSGLQSTCFRQYENDNLCQWSI